MAKPAKNKGGAPEGNKNAEKWTQKEVLSMMSKIEAAAKKPTCYYLGSALVEVGLYKEIWSRWEEKFKTDDVVSQSIKRINQIFEAKLFSAALSGSVNSTVAIFGLKNNHEWKDKVETDHSGNMGIVWEEKRNYDKK